MYALLFLLITTDCFSEMSIDSSYTGDCAQNRMKMHEEQTRRANQAMSMLDIERELVLKKQQQAEQQMKKQQEVMQQQLKEQEEEREDVKFSPYSRTGTVMDIELQNGSIVRTDSYWEEGGLFCYLIYGSVVKIDKSSIRSIKDAK